MIAIELKKNHFIPQLYLDPKVFLHQWKAKNFDLVVLDLQLPAIDGIEVLKEIRLHNPRIPIIILSARSDETDRILGLELGADDYMTKPFSLRELTARVKAQFRRYDNLTTKDIYTVGPITIDAKRYRVEVRQQEVRLTPTEFKLLLFFVQHEGWVLSRDQILNHIGDPHRAVIDRTVDVHIKNLRKKLGMDLIENIRGVGYRFQTKRNGA